MPEWLTVGNAALAATVVCTVASVIASVTPSTSDDKVVQVLVDIVNRLGLNVGEATNKDDWR